MLKVEIVEKSFCKELSMRLCVSQKAANHVFDKEYPVFSTKSIQVHKTEKRKMKSHLEIFQQSFR